MTTVARARRQRLALVFVAIALLATLTLGLAMRGFFARWHGLGGLRLDNVLHAHSHLGYYGVLFPLAWLSWRAAGVRLPQRRVLVVYGAAVALSLAGFLRAGYGPAAIAGSTLVALVWLQSVWPLRQRMRDVGDPLPAALGGVILGELCIPPIGYTYYNELPVVFDIVATFLALLLLAVIVPSALAARGQRAPWPVLLAAAAGGALFLGVWPALPTRLCLVLYAVVLTWSLARGRVPLHLRVAWATVAVGLVSMAAGLVPNTRPVALGAIHFLVLGPVLTALAGTWLRSSPPTWAWWLYYVAVGLLAAPLIAQGLGHGPWTVTAAAFGGVAVVAWWCAALLAQLKVPSNSRTG